jgi:Flp pilus assembly protein TadG
VVKHTPSPTRAAPRPWQDLPRKRGGGQALVEFAIALPILMLLVAGVLELGRGYGYAIATSDAARDGARYAAGKTSLTNGPGLASMCSIITADLAAVTTNISCPTLVAHAPPFVSGTDFTNPVGDQAVVVVYCGTSLNCAGTTNALYQSEIDVYVYYGFNDLNLFGGRITISGSSKTTTSW